MNTVKLYVVTYGSGGVVAIGMDESAVKAKVEKHFANSASEFEWREDWGGLHRLYYRVTSTGRWNKIPGRFIQVVEVEL